MKDEMEKAPVYQPKFTDAFKSVAVRLVLNSGRP